LDASSSGVYRPISLIHSFAKLVTKVLANKLAPHVTKLISANQSAFIKGCLIHDNYMLVHNSIVALKKKMDNIFPRVRYLKSFLIQFPRPFYLRFLFIWVLVLDGAI
jgi:hypothetical protein